jgi:hypothetical protein
MKKVVALLFHQCSSVSMTKEKTVMGASTVSRYHNPLTIAADSMKQAMQLRDGLRSFAAANHGQVEYDCHKMADRMDAIAKEIGIAALTLKAAGALAPARQQEVI